MKTYGKPRFIMDEMGFPMAKLNNHHWRND